VQFLEQAQELVSRVESHPYADNVAAGNWAGACRGSKSGCCVVFNCSLKAGAGQQGELLKGFQLYWARPCQYKDMVGFEMDEEVNRRLGIV
jgi:hypothetical protein